MKNIYQFWVGHGTKLIGFVQGTIATLAGITDLIPQHHLKYWMAAIAVLTFWRGYFNSSQNQPGVLNA